ncbi:recombinase family protein [Nocardioides marmoribigeumensis]|uniref:DNA invertase Pin-like site-specific DNA recombinase n=1 Tax=Nocardioides marmoribigeumensis TaxID=433649 RepID=A0ABU2C087_9ACTN|nr:recombinase family protein [Nocardioides marmoribigeumensis]MDR7364067.1 DNA invertase Pin-like site-specific DNA recombinase [Nocardioides marmoribigeumensis]
MPAIVGYRRVSTADQRLDRQILGGCDRMYEDTASGKDRDRPGLAACLAYVREGDTLRCHSADRLARSLADLIATVDDLTARGVRVEFIKEGLTFERDSADPYARCLFQVMGAFAELERNMIRARQAEGIALARQRGAYVGRMPALSPEEVRTARQRHADGVTLARLVRDYGVAKSTMQAALAGTGVYAAVAS